MQVPNVEPTLNIHAIIILGGDGTPPLHKIIGQLKSSTTKRFELLGLDYSRT